VLDIVTIRVLGFLYFALLPAVLRRRLGHHAIGLLVGRPFVLFHDSLLFDHRNHVRWVRRHHLVALIGAGKLVPLLRGSELVACVGRTNALCHFRVIHSLVWFPTHLGLLAFRDGPWVETFDVHALGRMLFFLLRLAHPPSSDIPRVPAKDAPIEEEHRRQ